VSLKTNISEYKMRKRKKIHRSTTKIFLKNEFQYGNISLSTGFGEFYYL